MNVIKGIFTYKICVFFVLTYFSKALLLASEPTFPIVDTGQIYCYNNYNQINYPRIGKNFFGQDAEYISNYPSYKDNKDGTVTDLVTGLMWSKGVDENKLSLFDAEHAALKMKLAGYKDWRVPTIKELYSLIDFRGYTGFTGSMSYSSVPSNAIPYINTDYFEFKYGNTGAGERYIDAQWLTKTKYVSTTMGGAETLFGVNFADGRIKGYGYKRYGVTHKKFYVRYVRGNPAYGKNSFIDNKNKTITDNATGLMWMKFDSGKGMNWEDALKYADNLKYAGYDDWRLPSAKELQSIVDYTRSPDTTNSAAINPIFITTQVINESGVRDYPYFWTSTTHLDGPQPGSHAAYISFGRAIGQMQGTIMDVHGAGAQRSDPKIGTAMFRGPQGDAVRVLNFVRCVRGGNVKLTLKEPKQSKRNYPYNVDLVNFTTFKHTQSSNRFINNDSFRSNRNHMLNNHEKPGFIQRLDQNKDGKVSIDEFDGPKDHFKDFDSNNDGYISGSEAPQGPPS